MGRRCTKRKKNHKMYKMTAENDIWVWKRHKTTSKDKSEQYVKRKRIHVEVVHVTKYQKLL